jgi:lipopolysaccharide biosynthesis regulator YciM
MSFLIAGVVLIAIVAVMVLFIGKKSGGGGNKKGGKVVKNRAQIIKEANRRLSKNPHDPIGLMSLADVYFESQLWEKAFSYYDELSKIGAHDTTVDSYKSFLRLGICCMNLQKFPEGAQALLSAYRIDPVSYESNYQLGNAMVKLEQFDKAAPLFKKALLANPEAHGIYFTLGQCYYKARKFRECQPCFKKAIEEEPGNKEAYFCLADSLFQDGHGEKAIKVFMNLRGDPKYGARSCLMAGLFHMKTNSVDEAVQDFEIGLKHEDSPDDIKLETEYNLARCCFEKNRIADGLNYLKAIRNKSQNYKDVNSLINRYQELSQNSNLQIYVAAPNSEFVNLCRKFIYVKYKGSNIKINNIDPNSMYTDILADISTPRWEDEVLFRFFRTTGSIGEIYIREFHGHMADVKAARGFCVSAGSFSQEGRKYIEGRPIDLIEKAELVKILKHIS